MGYFFKEERGRPFVDFCLGHAKANIEFEGDIKYDESTLIDIGIGGGYDYHYSNGNFLAVGGRLNFMNTSGPFKYEDSEELSGDNYSLEYSFEDEVSLTKTSLSLFARYYHVF